MKESQFRQKIEKALTKDQSNTVYPNHGQGEFGIDFIVYKKDIFEEERCYGIQVKTGNIYASKKGKNPSLKEIIGQLVIAFGHTFPPKNKNIDAIYLVTNGEIHSTAREYILSAQIGFRTIYFIDKKNLKEFFKNRRISINFVEP